jgi:hypothetical protein
VEYGGGGMKYDRNQIYNELPDGARKYFQKGKLVRVVYTENGVTYDAAVRRDTIKVKGYSEWVSVTYMDDNRSREDCVVWVLYLIIEKGRR